MSEPFQVKLHLNAGCDLEGLLTLECFEFFAHSKTWRSGGGMNDHLHERRALHIFLAFPSCV